MIRKFSSLLVIVLFTLVTVSNVMASNGTQIGTVGARSTAMGSSFRGLADDWSALFFNPGGLTQLDEKWTIGLSGGYIMPRGTYTAYQYPSVPFAGLYTDEREATPKNFIVPAFGAFYKASERLVFGLGVYAPFGLGTEWDLMFIPANYGNVNAISKEKEHFSDHQVINIQPTMAFKLTPRISMGLGLSYIWGKMTLDMVKTPYHPLLGIWTDSTNPLYPLVGLGVIPALSTDQYRLIVENQLEGSGSAYGFNLGFLFDITRKLSLGISGRYTTDLHLKGDMLQTIAFPGNATMVATFNGLVTAGYLTAQQAAQMNATFSGANMEEEYEVEADLPLPWTVGAGLAWKPSPRFTLTLDANLTNWASWGDILVDVEEGDDVELKQDWNDTWEFGGGFEWMAMGNEYRQFFIRGGFYTVDTPAPAETMNPTLLDPNRRYVITGGLGFNIGHFNFDLAAEYVLFSDRDIEDYVIDAATGIPENFAGKYHFNAFVVTFGTTIEL